MTIKQPLNPGDLVPGVISSTAREAAELAWAKVVPRLLPYVVDRTK